MIISEKMIISEIKKKETKIVNQISGHHKNISLYIHIPFCDVICPYCDFNKFSKVDNLIPEFIDSLVKEVEIRKIKNSKVSSIFFGGGTPSYISDSNLDLIFKNLKLNFDFNSEIEISIEVNPKDINRNKIKFYENLGINRISIGGQSFDNSVLKKLGRNHSSRELIETIELIKQSNIKNINLDLIYGVPGQEISSWEKSLEKFIEFSIPHLSAYQLTFEPKTKFFKDLLTNKIKELDENIIVKMFNKLNEFMTNNNYKNYEISNWSKPKMESQHNLKYWKKENYLGFGPGASSFIDNNRLTNVRSLKKYISNFQNSNLQFDEDYTLNRNDKLIENIMLNLRLYDGIKHNEFKEKFNIDFEKSFSELTEKLIKYDLLKINNASTRLTQKGKLLSDSIFLMFEEQIQASSF